MTPEPIVDDFGLSPDDHRRYLTIFEPDFCTPRNEIPLVEFKLIVAVNDGASDHDIRKAVQAARAAGTPWTRIAEILGVSISTARRRHGAR